MAEIAHTCIAPDIVYFHNYFVFYPTSGGVQQNPHGTGLDENDLGGGGRGQKPSVDREGTAGPDHALLFFCVVFPFVSVNNAL